MAASKSEGQSAWPDLPPELLGAVLRLLPSLADRVRLRAVCRPWRSGATGLPPSHLHLPWLVFGDGTLLDVANNAAHRGNIPDDAVCYSAGDNMLFVAHDDGRCSLVDAFSGAAAATPLPELAALLRARKVNPRDLLQPITKVAVSTSSAELEEGCRLIAVVIDSEKVIISTCRPAGETNACLALDDYFDFCIADIKFFQGRIYALSKRNETLCALDLNKGRINELPESPPGFEVIRGGSSDKIKMDQEPHLQEDPWPFGHMVAGRYLVVSNGKLLMVRRWTRKPLLSSSSPYSIFQFRDPDGYEAKRNRRFEVFEMDRSYRPWQRNGRWSKLQDLDGQALFVSPPCSKSAPPARHGAREDCIYFVHQMGPWKPEDPLGDSGVYNMRDGTITRPLLPEPAALSASLPWSYRFPAWVFPVD
ncbi:uncharacterized protein [Lolium perenne]|uniref:uncharacterized protein n=1 Tax=Lolium perenne TaxID=4522 RepID=UPI0021F59CC4|nr:uncharacterized protein LOC127325768 [Lolium perenne]